MKKLPVYIMLAAMSGLALPLPSQAPCVTYHRQAGCSQASEDGFLYNSQSKSGLFARGTTSKLKAVFYSGFDYSISMCADKLLGTGIGMVLSDATTGEVLYDNATDNKATHFEFSNETTRNMFITITIPGSGPGKGKSADAACLGILIEQKVTPKVGF
ncbi:MAG TPA: hypothetical protein VFU15_09220 [Bacteroidia bacterium]|nr:hypothetical protein [Bacteroidia bacterium]